MTQDCEASECAMAAPRSGGGNMCNASSREGVRYV